MSKISRKMVLTLEKLKEDGPRAAYPGLSLATLNALYKLGLCQRRGGLGYVFSPRTQAYYTINKEGEEAIASFYNNSA